MNYDFNVSYDYNASSLSRPSQGIATPLLVISISLLVMSVAIIGISAKNTLLQTKTEAAIIASSKSVRLLENSIWGNTVQSDPTGRTIRVGGEFCFGFYPSTGQPEKWTIWATGEGVGDLSPDTGRSIDNGTIYAGPTAGFPAICDYTDELHGLAKWRGGDSSYRSPTNFSLTLKLPRKPDAGYCPDILLNYRGSRTDGIPFAVISLDKVGICKQEAPTDIPTEVPTEVPTDVPTEIPTETPKKDTISGKVLDFDDYSPIQGATVETEDGSLTVTDSDGKYELILAKLFSGRTHQTTFQIEDIFYCSLTIPLCIVTEPSSSASYTLSPNLDTVSSNVGDV
jgi:hypothetical protein